MSGARDESRSADETRPSAEDFGASAVTHRLDGVASGGVSLDDGLGGSRRRLGRFELLDELGRGGQGRVFLARDLKLQRSVALKILPSRIQADSETILRFQREAEAASRLADPGICPVYDSGAIDGVLYIAMRHVEGETLARWIADGEASWEQCVAMIEAMARSVHVAHEAGIVHRDLKPANVIVTRGVRPVILDFGLARDETSDLASLTETGDVFGTPHYMSPEQLDGKRVDRRSDVWSLGVILYEALTGRRPFVGATRDVVFDAIRRREPPSPRRLGLSLPRDLLVVMDTALAKEPERRYPTAMAFAEELHRVLAFEPVHTRPPGPLLRLRLWGHRNPRIAASLAIVLISLVSALAVSLHFLGTAREAGQVSARALRREADQRAEAERARARATRALNDYERLADAALLRRFEARARRLWPPRPALCASLDAWLAEARELAGRLPSHREARDALEADLLPYDEKARAADRARNAEDHPAVGEALDRLDRVAKKFAKARDKLLADPNFKKQLAKLDSLRVEHEAKLGRRHTWAFASPQAAWRYETLSALVTALDRFVAEDPAVGTLASVAARRALVDRIERVSLVEAAPAWKKVLAEVADAARSPAYGGLVMKPQFGLVPLGPDPESGLQEFAELLTGEAPARDPDSGRLQVDAHHGLVFVLIPGGEFRMGGLQPPPGTVELEKEELPVLKVTLAPFFLSKFEMTRAQWQRAEALKPHKIADLRTFPLQEVTPRHPVEAISWDQSWALLRRLGLLLPTEAQWEFAARGGTTTRWWTGDEVRSVEGAANLRDRRARDSGAPGGMVFEDWLDDGWFMAAPVGRFRANPYGLHDVIGNLAEWCHDCYATYKVFPRPGDGLRALFSPIRERAVRGGSYQDQASVARSSGRWNWRGELAPNGVGLRPARALDP